MRIRHATTADLAWLVRASARMSEEPPPLGDPRLLPADPNLCGELWRHAVADHLVLIAVNDNGENVGLVFGWRSYHPFNPALRTLTSALWYVLAEHRTGRAAVMLMDAFIAWGEEHADFVSFTVRTPGAISALERRGFGSPEAALVRWSANQGRP